LNLGACLADDMGLGKTLQTITLVEKFRTDPTRKAIAKGKPKLSTQISLFDTQNSDEEDGFEYQTPSIIVMPTSLLHNWRMEMRKFAPHLNVLIHYGPERTRNVRNFDFYDVVLTSYGVIRNDINWLRNYKFNLLILDESQFIKNPTSKNYKSLLTLESFQRVILTGTPIENSLKDLWAQMNFINPGVLGSLNLFQNRFISPIEKSGDEEAYLKLRTLIHPFILRRTKEEVAKDLPPVQNFVEYCEMNESQKELYEKEKAKARNFLMREVKRNGIESSAMVVLRALIRLRQIAIHPELIDEKGLGSGKFEMIKEKIKVVLSEDHNLLIFSSFVKHLDLLQSFLEEKRIPYSILKGDTLNREQVIEEFNREDSKKVFLISIKAGGFGLNLTKADYVFITDPWWNPAVEEQAISRAHRIGQTRNVFVYRFISQASIEEKIVKLQERKKELADQLINSDNVLKDLNYSDLESLFS
jgi:SNF2 family DNA or RNA helicase